MKKYVDAGELLKHKRKMRGFDLCEEFWTEAVLCEDIYNAPAAEVAEVRHGSWIDAWDDDVQRCSACNHIFHYPRFYGYNYCPHCGAKMYAERIEE